MLGLVLLLTFLGWRGRVPAAMDQVGSTILQHLGLLFLPASVGVVMFWPLLKAHALAVSAALVHSVVATIAVTALLLKWLAAPRAQDEHAPCAPTASTPWPAPRPASAWACRASSAR